MENVSPLWDHLGVALIIKDKETEALVNEIASLAGVTTTEAVRQAAQERLERLGKSSRFSRGRRLDYDPRESSENFRYWLETEIWPLIPEEERGGEPMTKAEREEILGYGPGEV